MTSTISQNGAWGTDAWQTMQNFTDPIPSSDELVRQSYNAKVTAAYHEFLKKALEFHDNGQCFGPELAREAFETRNAIKEAHQAQTSWLGRAAIYVRNLLTYGAGNVTFESLSKNKTPEELAYSAFKTDGSDLGLEGNGFADILRTWYAIKDVSTLYPEDITPEMVEAFKAQSLRNLDPERILAVYVPDPNKAFRLAPQSPVQKLVDDLTMKSAKREELRLMTKADVIVQAQPVHHRDFATYM